MDKKFDISILRDADIWKIESADDNHLMSYFIEIPVFKTLCNNKHYVVCGRKGTGKTALRKAFEARVTEKKGLVKSVEFTDLFSTSFFDGLICNHEELKKTNRDLIKFNILIQWMMILIHDEDISSVDRGILEGMLKDNGYMDLSLIGKGLLENKSVKTTHALDLKIKSIGYGYQKEMEASEKENEIDYIKLLPYLAKWVFSLMKSGKQYNLLIDGLDKLWTEYKDSGDIYLKVVLNLILGIGELNRTLHDSTNNQSRAIAFIRKDMLDLIEGENGDMGKLLDDYTLFINWQSGYSDEGSLLNEMMERRLEAGLKLIGNNPNEYHHPLLANAITNSQILKAYNLKPPSYCKDREKGCVDVKKFVYNKTLLRPRDCIAFLKYLSQNTDVARFESEYSTYYKRQTLDELKPIFRDEFKIIEDAVREMCRHSSGEFKGENFKKTFASLILARNGITVISQDVEKHTDYLKHIRKAEAILKELYAYSVIGYFDTVRTTDGEPVKIDGRIKRKPRFHHREVDSRQFNDNECLLHSGLYKAMGIV